MTGDVGTLCAVIDTKPGVGQGMFGDLCELTISYILHVEGRAEGWAGGGRGQWNLHDGIEDRLHKRRRDKSCRPAHYGELLDV